MECKAITECLYKENLLLGPDYTRQVGSFKVKVIFKHIDSSLLEFCLKFEILIIFMVRVEKGFASLAELARFHEMGHPSNGLYPLSFNDLIRDGNEL